MTLAGCNIPYKKTIRSHIRKYQMHHNNSVPMTFMWSFSTSVPCRYWRKRILRLIVDPINDRSFPGYSHMPPPGSLNLQSDHGRTICQFLETVNLNVSCLSEAHNASKKPPFEIHIHSVPNLLASFLPVSHALQFALPFLPHLFGHIFKEWLEKPSGTPPPPTHTSKVTRDFFHSLPRCHWVMTIQLLT